MQTQLWLPRNWDPESRWSPAGHPRLSLPHSTPPPPPANPLWTHFPLPLLSPLQLTRGPPAELIKKITGQAVESSTLLAGRNQRKIPWPHFSKLCFDIFFFSFFIFFPKSFFIMDFRKHRPWQLTQQVLAKTKVLVFIGLEEVRTMPPPPPDAQRNKLPQPN